MNGVREKPALALGRCLEPLKNLAEDECWGENNIILVNYFVHTFHGLYQARKKAAPNQQEPGSLYLVEHNDAIHFHTGLVTANMEPIFVCFPKNQNPGSRGTVEQPQYFINETSTTQFLLGGHMAIRCYPLPIQCRYVDDYSHLIMYANNKPIVNFTHIIDQNWRRVCTVLYPNNSPDDNKFRDQHRNDANLKLNGALEMALVRVKANYRTAVPQFYKGQ